jgi:hypothetical protein
MFQIVFDDLCHTGRSVYSTCTPSCFNSLLTKGFSKYILASFWFCACACSLRQHIYPLITYKDFKTYYYTLLMGKHNHELFSLLVWYLLLRLAIFCHLEGIQIMLFDRYVTYLYQYIIFIGVLYNTMSAFIQLSQCIICRKLK